MAPQDQAEQDEIASGVLAILSNTPYACSSLALLNGGSANLVFRGVIESAPVTTVIVKLFLAHLASNKSFFLDPSRFTCEESMLRALDSFASGTATRAGTPRLLYSDEANKIQVHQDVPAAVDVLSVLGSPTTDEALTKSAVETLWRDLGAWLRALHEWTSAPEQAGLRKIVARNEPMRRLKYRWSYGCFISELGNYPGVMEEGDTSTLDQVRDAATLEFERKAAEDGDDENWGILHGDFWTGNVLVSRSRQASDNRGPELFIIDWELAQFGHRAYDLGQMVGDLVERMHYKGIRGSPWAIRGLVDGYGGLDDDMAFRTAIHAGVHLIGWHHRGAPTGPRWDDREKIVGGMRLGRNFIIKGWQRDREWFSGGPLAPLFCSE